MTFAIHHTVPQYLMYFFLTVIPKDSSWLHLNMSELLMFCTLFLFFVNFMTRVFCIGGVYLLFFCAGFLKLSSTLSAADTIDALGFPSVVTFHLPSYFQSFRCMPAHTFYLLEDYLSAFKEGQNFSSLVRLILSLVLSLVPNLSSRRFLKFLNIRTLAFL